MVIRSTSTEVFPARILKISGHESDIRFYECAEAASADFLITGNTKDFSRDYKTTRIITPRAFLDLIIALARAAADRLLRLADRGPYSTVDPGSIPREVLHERPR